MKKNLGILFVMASLLFPALSLAQVTDLDPNPSSQCANITQNLRYGMRDSSTNTNISMLQDFLSTNGYLNVTASGFFGKVTLTAVEAFQSKNGITPTGYVGTNTRAKIKAIDCNGASSETSVSNTPVSVHASESGSGTISSNTKTAPTPAPSSSASVSDSTSGSLTLGQSSYSPGCSPYLHTSSVDGEKCVPVFAPLVPATPVGVFLGSCDIDIVAGTNTCGMTSAISMMSQGLQQGVLKVTLDPLQAAPAVKVRFDVTFGSAPAGWNVDIGDSVSNDGYGLNDGMHMDTAEMQLQSGTDNSFGFNVYGNGYTLYHPEATKDGHLLVKKLEYPVSLANKTISFTIGDQDLAYNFGNIGAGSIGDLNNRYLYLLGSEKDFYTNAATDNTIYVAFNRSIIQHLDRTGSGVTKVHITLFGAPAVVPKAVIQQTPSTITGSSTLLSNFH